ncbi:MAG: NAD(P)/FAD-dependent oxidoreductase [Phreatobacter sp.]
MRIAVVGGGIIGIAVTHALLDEGHEVELIDRDGPSGGASAGNAGWIAHMDILPLASPKAWTHLPRWMLDPLGPLSIAPAHLPRLLPWLLRFGAASMPGRIAAGSAAIRAINAVALPAWERRLARLGQEALLRRRGVLSVWTNPSDFAAAAALHSRQSALGIPVERLDAAGVCRLEPAFGQAVVGGAFYETGVHVADPRLLLERLSECAWSRGARRTLSEVSDLEPSTSGVTLHLATSERIVAERVVLAAGAWSRHLAARSGDRVPLDTERGYNITVAPGSLGLARPVMYEGQGFVTTPLDTGDRIGGSVEFAGLNAPANWARVDAMLGRLKRVLPDSNVGEGVRWMGFRPSTPDSLPVIGHASRDPRILYAFGHGHYGLTQAAVTADMVAALIADRQPPAAAAPYSPQRF